MKINRRIQVYVFHGLLIFLAGYRISISGSTMSKYSWIILLLLALISLIHILIRKNYMEITGSQLRINRDFFRTQTLELKDIVKIEIEPNPFNNSYILMRDGRKVKFSDSYINDKQLKEVMRQVHIDVS